MAISVIFLYCVHIASIKLPENYFVETAMLILKGNGIDLPYAWD